MANPLLSVDKGKKMNYFKYFRVCAYAKGHKLLALFGNHDEALEFACRQPAPGAFVKEVIRRVE
jgi:hypothetical protein